MIMGTLSDTQQKPAATVVATVPASSQAIHDVALDGLIADGLASLPLQVGTGTSESKISSSRAPHSCIAYAARSWNHPAIFSRVTSCKAEPNAA